MRQRYQLVGGLFAGLALLSATMVSAQSVSFHGYARTGIGLTNGEGQQLTFVTPQAPKGYRLGNEGNANPSGVNPHSPIYTEIELGANLYEEEDTSFDIVTMLAYTGEGDSSTDYIDSDDNDNDIPPFDGDADDISIRQLYAQATGIFGGALSDASVWAGSRYYRRHDIHLKDLYYWDTSGYGAGIEDISLGFGNFHLAWITRVLPPAGPDPDDDGILSPVVNTLDLRVSDIAVNRGGVLTVGVDFRANATDDTTYEDNDGDTPFGVGLTVIHQQNGFLGGFNKAALQIAQGQMASLWAGGINNFAGVTDDTDNWRVQANNQTVAQLSERLSMMAVGLYQVEYDDDQEDGDGEYRHWISAGVRPIYHFTQYTGLEFEVGTDVILNPYETSDDDMYMVNKATIAGVVKPNTGFFARPEIRAYVSGFFWDDETAGGTPEQWGTFENNFAFNVGVQAEFWW